MNTRHDLSQYLGLITEEHCPNCGDLIIQDSTGVQWCNGDECTWSNDPELQDFIKLLKHDEDN
jgi:hypothetical protein